MNLHRQGTAIKNGAANGSRALMSAQASLRVFERLITVDIAKEQLQEIIRFTSETKEVAEASSQTEEVTSQTEEAGS